MLSYLFDFLLNVAFVGAAWVWPAFVTLQAYTAGDSTKIEDFLKYWVVWGLISIVVSLPIIHFIISFIPLILVIKTGIALFLNPLAGKGAALVLEKAEPHYHQHEEQIKQVTEKLDTLAETVKTTLKTTPLPLAKE